MVAMSFNILVVLLSGAFLFRSIWKKIKESESHSQSQETMKMKSMNGEDMNTTVVREIRGDEWRTQEEINEEVEQKRKDWRAKRLVFVRVFILMVVPFIDSILGKLFIMWTTLYHFPTTGSSYN